MSKEEICFAAVIPPVRSTDLPKTDKGLSRAKEWLGVVPAGNFVVVVPLEVLEDVFDVVVFEDIINCVLVQRARGAWFSKGTTRTCLCLLLIKV